MKLKNILKEFTIPLDHGTPFDDMQSRDNEDAMPRMNDKLHKDRERIPKTPRRKSNLKKAQNIRNMINVLKRERSNVRSDDVESTVVDQGETEPVKAAHGSNFLFR